MIERPSPETEELLDLVTRAVEPAARRAQETADGFLWEAIGEAGALVNGNDRRGIPWTSEGAWRERLRFILGRLRGTAPDRNA